MATTARARLVPSTKQAAANEEPYPIQEFQYARTMIPRSNLGQTGPRLAPTTNINDVTYFVKVSQSIQPNGTSQSAAEDSRKWPRASNARKATK